MVIKQITYRYHKQKRRGKVIYAVWEGDLTTYSKYVCGFPCKEAAEHYCRTKNAEVRQKNWR